MDLTNASSIYYFGDYNSTYNGCYFKIQDSSESFITYLQNTPTGININGSTKITQLGFDSQSRFLINNDVNLMRTYIGANIYGFKVDSSSISYLGDYESTIELYNKTYLKVTNDAPFIIQSYMNNLQQGFYLEDDGGSLLAQFGDYYFNTNNTYVEINNDSKSILMSTHYLKLNDKGTGNLLDDTEFPLTANVSLNININGTPYTIELFQP
jgi:hypothetical protein